MKGSLVIKLIIYVASVCIGDTFQILSDSPLHTCNDCCGCSDNTVFARHGNDSNIKQERPHQTLSIARKIIIVHINTFVLHS